MAEQVLELRAESRSLAQASVAIYTEKNVFRGTGMEIMLDHEIE